MSKKHMRDQNYHHRESREKDSATVLVVEDNQNLNEVIRRALELKGYLVATAYNLQEASEKLNTAEPDVVLLDVMLPDGDGMDFAAEITANAAFDGQIVFLTAKTADEDRYRGLGVGDDYITKPFAPMELTARVEAALTRLDRRRRSKTLLQKGALKLDMLSAQAFLMDKDLLLTQKEFSVLLLLVQNAGMTISASALYEKVWKAPLGDDSQSLRTVVSRLRKKLGEGFVITNMSNEGSRGYRFEMNEP
jgi:DNA-binding response OmpR family regulator